MQRGHELVVAFLTNLPSRSDACKPSACKPSTSEKRECTNCGVSKCDRSDLLLKACSRCKLVYYCSKPCQQQHWIKGEHKRFCLAIADRKPIKAEASVQSTKPHQTRQTHASQPNVAQVSNAECAVCLEPLNTSIMCALACGHFFHHECIAGIKSFGLSKKCPLCRSELK